MTMRENIAKAVFTEISKGSGQPGGKKYWETSPKEVKLFCYAITDAVMEAMKEPTEAVLDAYNSHCAAEGTFDSPIGEDVWRVMIEAAAK